MVKQYQTGYFIRGKWYNGSYNKSYDVLNIYENSVYMPASSTIKTGQIITSTGNSACIADNAWSCGDYKIIEEPIISSPSISIPVIYIYLITAIIIVLTLILTR